MKTANLFSALLLVVAPSVSAIRNSLYVISEAETPSLGLDGLTPVGLKRATECLLSVFQHLGIGLILSCTPDPVTGSCYAAVATVTPLAEALGLTVDISCGNGEDAEDDCVTDLITNFAANSTRAILAVWDAADQDTFFENVDIELPEAGDDADPTFYHDVINTVRNDVFIGTTSQNCPGIDGQAPGTGIFAKHAGEGVPPQTRRKRSAKGASKKRRSSAKFAKRAKRGF